MIFFGRINLDLDGVSGKFLGIKLFLLIVEIFA